MSPTEKLFIRKMWTTFLTAVLIQLAVGLVVGFGIMNRDHFQTKSNTEDIKKIQGNFTYYATDADVANLIKALDDKNRLWENALINERSQNNVQFQNLQTGLNAVNVRIDQIAMKYSSRGSRPVESLLNEQ